MAIRACDKFGVGLVTVDWDTSIAVLYVRETSWYFVVEKTLTNLITHFEHLPLKRLWTKLWLVSELSCLEGFLKRSLSVGNLLLVVGAAHPTVSILLVFNKKFLKTWQFCQVILYFGVTVDVRDTACRRMLGNYQFRGFTRKRRSDLWFEQCHTVILRNNFWRLLATAAFLPDTTDDLPQIKRIWQNINPKIL
jgi:hypothetical protein